MFFLFLYTFPDFSLTDPKFPDFFSDWRNISNFPPFSKASGSPVH